MKELEQLIIKGRPKGKDAFFNKATMASNLLRRFQQKMAGEGNLTKTEERKLKALQRRANKRVEAEIKLSRDIERAVSQVEKERKKYKTSAGAKDKSKTTTPLKSVSVKSGDTLIALSKRHGVSLEKLKQLNPKVKPRQMQIGSRIKLR
jgi:LysM repeat protein